MGGTGFERKFWKPASGPAWKMDSGQMLGNSQLHSSSQHDLSDCGAGCLPDQLN